MNRNAIGRFLLLGNIFFVLWNAGWACWYFEQGNGGEGVACLVAGLVNGAAVVLLAGEEVTP